MTAVARWLRLDGPTWERAAEITGTGSAVLVAGGAFAIFAFNRFGTQGLTEIRGVVRMLLVGFYGWAALALALWLVARFSTGFRGSPGAMFRVVGHAHLPLLFTALTLQVSGVVFRIFGPGLVVAAFAVVFWMPALLVAALRTTLEVSVRRSLGVVAVPYLVWLAVVGRYLETQVGHLL